MSVEPCPNAGAEGCPWFERPTPKNLQGQQEHGCYSDVDHVVPKRWRTLGKLIGLYIQTPDNQRQLCRWEHDRKPRERYEDIPEDEVMYDAVMRAVGDGKLRLNRRDREGLQKYGE